MDMRLLLLAVEGLGREAATVGKGRIPIYIYNDPEKINKY